jgi:hypothetical protein
VIFSSLSYEGMYGVGAAVTLLGMYIWILLKNQIFIIDLFLPECVKWGFRINGYVLTNPHMNTKIRMINLRLFSLRWYVI